MSGDGGNPPSLRDLLGAYEKSGLMDLDNFKLINDTYGHFIGDKVLIHFTQTIQALLRKSDLIGRVGGE